MCIYMLFSVYVASANTAKCYCIKAGTSTQNHFNIHGNTGYHQQRCVYIVQLMMGNPMQSIQIQADMQHR